jgi:Helix-turn-helix domain
VSDRSTQPLNAARALAAVVVHLDGEQLRPLVEAVVAEAVRQLDADRQRLGDGKLAYSEGEAAGLLGLEEHQLRDERRRGRIAASAIVGRRIRYQRSDLLAYLTARRVNGSDRQGA